MKNNIYINNILDSNRSGSLIRGRFEKKINTNSLENNYNENFSNNKEITSESNININISTLPIADRDKNTKKIFFTIAPHINNMINLNKIKYIIRNISKENIINSYNNEFRNFKNYKTSKHSKNKVIKKNNLINNKNIYHNKNMNKKSYSFKSSNTQISSSLGTAACSIGKNSHLMDYETIKVYKNRKFPPKTINEKNKKKNKDFSDRKFSLSPAKIESKQFIKKILLNNPIYKYDNCNKSLNNNITNKKILLNEQNKKQQNLVLPIRKEKEGLEIKIKEMVNLILNNKDILNNCGNTSRNSKKKYHHKVKSIITLTNRTNNSLSMNRYNKNPMISIKTSKNSNSNHNKFIFPHNQTDFGYLNNYK